MKQRYLTHIPVRVLTALVVLAIFAVSCSKKNSTPTAEPFAKIGLYEYQSGIYKRIYMPVAAVGTQNVTNNSTELPEYAAFDTGSTGLTMDASGLIPASMITSSGFVFTGDSVVVNDITIIKGILTVKFGDAISNTTEYGNLAYATFTLGQPGDTQITTKRIPFFLYYKVVDEKGTVFKAHEADVFGVGSGVSYASSKIASPLSYFTSANNTISGFKLAAVDATGFTVTNGMLVKDMLTIGLVPSDLTSAGFIMHPLSSFSVGGYSDNISATITYNNTVVSSAQILFDTGTPAISVIEDPKATGVGALAVNSTVKITTNRGFTFLYTVGANGNLTSIQNPNNTNDYRSIFSLDFFINNQYLVDYQNHQIGLKNN
ncbi:hypothetical protein KXQ82_08835 [Mucilaginibacter sp. HMF5004]|uniref:hypothetical protein n=1 Tax=Mucilaginibacter rivuli TaxID=2857527 RepID=UPI001C5E1D54|nr:hypothetical protein [Mucilaginibacter rivuli]MBW4889819.1 hypothetical protein [Mucilaginibacter rivuli]